MLKLIDALDMNFNNVLEYYNSFNINHFKDINHNAIRISKYGEKRYLEWLKNHSEKLFYLVDTNNENYIIGFGSINIKNYHNDYSNIGNIGYGVRPNERNKGYGTIILDLLLSKCEENGMSEVCISCKKDNIASQKIILKHKGRFDTEFYEDFVGYGLKYWIKLHPKISNRIHIFIKRNNSKKI